MRKVTIGEITENLDNRRKPLNNQARAKISKEKLYPYYGANNVMDYVDEYIFDEEILCIAEDGGSWGLKERCSYIVKEKCWINNHAHVLKVKSGNNIKYLYYYLNYNDLNKYITGSTRGKLTKSALNNIEIFLPEEFEQNKIVEVLDRVQSLIDKKKEQIELLDELVKSRFIEMFGDVLTSNKFGESILKEVADITSSKRIYANEYVENGIPFYRSKEIRELGENLKPSIELFISEEKYNLIKEKYEIPKKGDILIAAIGATIGYTWIVNTDEPFYYKDGNLLNISVNKNMNPIYLNHVLKILINNFKYREASGSAQLALTIDKVGKMEIPVPPIELQNEFAEFVTQTDSIRSKMETSLSELEDNFNSLMQKAFKGELF